MVEETCIIFELCFNIQLCEETDIDIINLKNITMTKKFKLKTAKKKVFFFLKRSYKIIPFNNNNAICQRNITEQPSNMNFHFPGCSVF